MPCEYQTCKFKNKPDSKYCGKHIKVMDKLEHPEKYCTKKGCKRSKKTGYKRCEKCIENGKKSDSKRRNIKIDGKCRNFGDNIEKFKTISGKKSTLCKTHYNELCKIEDNRPGRDREEEQKVYDEKRRSTEEYKKNRKIYNRSINFKLSEYKSKCSDNNRKNKEKYKWKISDEWGIALFKSPCYYCGKEPKKQDWNGIDRKDDKKHYTYDNARSCCTNCNMMKKCLGYEEFMKIRKQSVKFHSFLIDI